MASLFSGSFIGKKDLADFFQKMAMLIEAGYDTTSSCELILRRKNKKDHSADKIRGVAELLVSTLREGFSLHEAMEKHPRVFSKYVNQVAVGEMSGNTAEVLNRICTQIREGGNMAAKIRGALVYPITVLGITIIAGIYLFTQVMPQMLEMITELTPESELPWTTRAIIATGDWLKAYGIQVAIIAVLAIIVFTIYAKTIGRRPVSKLVAHMPIVGKIVQNTNMASYYVNWEQMIAAGAEMSIALQSAVDAIGNLDMRLCFQAAQAEYANSGVSISESLEKISYIQEMEVQTIEIALNAGGISKSLKLLAEDREREAERSLDRLTAAISPILIGIVGIIVGIVVMAVYAPITSVANSIS